MPASGGPRLLSAGSPANTGYDLDVVPPDYLNLWAPPYTAPGITVDYSERVTLLEVRDGTRAVTADAPRTPVPPSFGRWVGVRLKETNTGSQDAGVAEQRVIGTDGQTYYPQDPTMPGCAPRETFPPRSLAPGQTFTSCDTFDLPSKVGVRAVSVSIYFSNPGANGRWKIIARHPVTKRLVYAALGDSYSSGEGSGSYDKAPAACHRGADAWPRQVGRDLPGLLVMPSGGLIACSRATSDSLKPGKVPAGQVDQLASLRAMRPAPTLITVTMGGNDIGFANILWDCLWSDCYKKGGAIPDAEAKLAKETVTFSGTTRG